ncbi:helix-turn-helix domain-containing protein [Agromyces soli]
MEEAVAMRGLVPDGLVPDGPMPDLSGYVRRARRLADLSQRELSALIGVHQAQVARIEGGRGVDVATFARILAAAGLRLAVLDASGAEVHPMPRDVMRDRGGRRQPAHLDVLAAPDRPTPEMLARHREPEPRESWHRRRDARDRRRRRLGLDASHEQPTRSSVARWRAARQAARRERARLAAQRELTRIYARYGFTYVPPVRAAGVLGSRIGSGAAADPPSWLSGRGPLSGRDGPPATAPP